jgi:hypothetical protein
MPGRFNQESEDSTAKSASHAAGKSARRRIGESLFPVDFSCNLYSEAGDIITDMEKLDQEPGVSSSSDLVDIALSLPKIGKHRAI